MRAGNVITRIRSERVNKNLDTRSKFVNRGEETEDQPARVAEAEKVARLDPEAAVEQGAHGLFVWFKGGNAQDGIPASVRAQALDGRERCELPVEFSEVGEGSSADLIPDHATAFEPDGKCGLDGRIHG